MTASKTPSTAGSTPVPSRRAAQATPGRPSPVAPVAGEGGKTSPPAAPAPGSKAGTSSSSLPLSPGEADVAAARTKTPDRGAADLSEIPLGVCGCGCGSQVPIPRFIRGHYRPQFWQRVDQRGPDECWPWTGRMTKGYGRASWLGRDTGAHRIAYILTSGSDPGELHVDHLCHNRDAECAGGKTCPHRLCCNPAHLEAVTDAVNALRGKGITAAKAAQRECIRGHKFDKANTRIRKNGSRVCRKCEAVRNATRTAARRAVAGDGRVAA